MKALDFKSISKRTKIIIAAAAGVVVLAAIGAMIAIIANKHNIKTVARTKVLDGLDVLCAPNSIITDGEGGFLITDLYGKKIWRNVNGKSSVYVGADSVHDRYDEPIGGYNDATFDETLFAEPWAISPFLGGYAVTDTENNSVRLIRVEKGTQTINGESDVLEMGEYGVTFDHPTGLATDDDGNLYVSDTGRGAIRLITTEGDVETIADGLNAPTGLCYAGGTLYVAETGANRILTVKDGNLQVIAGSGEDGDKDGAAMSASFSSPQGVAVAADGTIYVGDTVNASVRRIINGTVDTILSQSDEVLETSPVSPTGVYVFEGNLYVCDYFSRMIYTLPIN